MNDIAELRRTLMDWVDTHLPYLDRQPAPSTAWFGVFQKCSSYVEKLITAATNALEGLDQTEGLLRAIADGKPPSRLTLGQRIQLLKEMEKPLRRYRNPKVHDNPLLGKNGRALLDEISSLRNQFVHGRLSLERSHLATVRFLEASRQLCDLPIIILAQEVENSAA